MLTPVSTYRVQLHSAFTLEELREILDYLHELGISTVYASPIFRSRKGSTHGYDVLDPYTIDPEIGSLGQFRIIAGELKQKGMSWLQDIVPNHMAFDGNNPWLKDIMELGPQSDHYESFDIDWEESGKVMAAFLGAPLEEVLEKKELQIIFHEDGFSWKYHAHIYPLSARSYARVLKDAEIGNWQSKFDDFSGNDLQWEDLRIGFFREVRENMALREQIKMALEDINTSSGGLKALLELQYFRPVHWKMTEEEINYRRFFTINELICLRVEDPRVLESYHYYLKELCDQGLISGLRIDHIDGLFDPTAYLKELRSFLKTDPYIIVEKIQELDEDLPSDWQAQGSTGYDFLAQVNQLFTQADNEEAFSQAYSRIAPEFSDYNSLVLAKKLFILKEEMGGELKNLFKLLQASDLLPGEGTYQEEDLQQALALFLASFPVYRIYPGKYPLSTAEKEIIETTYNQSLRSCPERREELRFLKSVFLGEAGRDPEKMLKFLQRSQQFTGPLAAKGVEDTVFYLYNRLISHNEVGDSPRLFGMTVNAFHEKMKQRQTNFPLSLNATATHDTKRGEDARMRLNVLSELPEEWFERVKEWQSITEPLKRSPEIPDPNVEYFIYQSLVGGFPFEKGEEAGFGARLKEYLQKALREAKLHTSWADPNEDYETSVLEFTEALLRHNDFLKSFKTFHHKISYYGALKSLGQTLVKVTAPGIPDVYQGTELWDLSFVDPDNRRPVDFNQRKDILSEFNDFKTDQLKDRLKELKTNFQDGKIKMYLLHKALKFRNSHQDIFLQGEYMPLVMNGENAEKLLGFARKFNEKWALVIVPLFVSKLFDATDFKPAKDAFSGVEISLPGSAPKSWKSLFTETEHSNDASLKLQLLLEEFPVALLTNI